MAVSNDRSNQKDRGSNFLVRFVRGSIILAALDRFCAYIYQLIKTGLFGYIFSGYDNNAKAPFFGRIRRTKAASLWAEFKYGLCRHIETSLIVGSVSRLMKYLLGCRTKVYGAFLSSFGVYTAISALIYSILSGSVNDVLSHPYLLPAIIMILASIPLVMSRKTLSESINGSFIGKMVLTITGFTKEDVSGISGDGGQLNTGFLLGLICGAATYAVSPVYIVGGIIGLLLLYLILIRPEIGVLLLFFAMPFLPTMALGGITAYTAVCFFIKLIRSKRIIRFEPIDIAVLAFAVLLFFGGSVSLSSSSLKPALLMVCFIAAYFLTVGLITTREWLVRCSVAAVISGTLESLYGIFSYFTGRGYSSDAWLDSEMFSSLSGRAVGTLENPNMLGEYLILIIPIAVGMFIGRGEGMRRLQAFLCIGAMGACLIFTWSRGAWLGLIFAALLFLFMWHRRSVWVIVAGIASIPFLPYVLPASIVARFTSIGNMGDSSTSYRVYIWRATINMIKDNFLTGIGIGGDAWNRVYPLYSYLGVEAAPHSHNLYLQIWLELGVAGIVAFLVFAFLLYQSGFTMFRSLSENTELASPDISEVVLKKNMADGVDTASEMRRGKIQLRISAAAPLCGVFAVLMQGMTDYSWYNYRLYLMFWLVAGLSSAYIRDGFARIRSADAYNYAPDNSSVDINAGHIRESGVNKALIKKEKTKSK